MYQMATGNCQMCTRPLSNTPEKAARVNCMKCGKKYRMCSMCQIWECKCGGGMESVLDRERKAGIIS
jgi:hypothetical protein